jgi:hypothetical protein
MGLLQALAGSIRDLRLAGVRASAQELVHSKFEVAKKGKEIVAILRAYERALGDENRVDYAGALELAAARLAREGEKLPGGARLLVPDFLVADLKGLEKRLLDAVEPGSRVVLASDDPSHRGMKEHVTSIFRAVGEANEVREVLRRCSESGASFDDVEIVYTDADTYVPLIFEIVSALSGEGEGEAPVTFCDGIPASFSRPGRALTAWLDWIGNGFRQPALVRMVQEGLLVVGDVRHPPRRIPGDETALSEESCRRMNDTPPARFAGTPPMGGTPPAGGWREAPGGLTIRCFSRRQ